MSEFILRSAIVPQIPVPIDSLIRTFSWKAFCLQLLNKRTSKVKKQSVSNIGLDMNFFATVASGFKKKK